MTTDIEDLIIIKKEISKLTDDEKDKFNSLEFIKRIKKEFKINCSKINLINVYNDLGLEDYNFKTTLIKKIQKSQSGIVSITVLTSGTPEYTNKDGIRVKGTFSCLHKCSFCPDEKPSKDNNWIQQPKSYLYTEPAVLRANQNDFDPIKQMNSRISSLLKNNCYKIDVHLMLNLYGSSPELDREMLN